VPQVGVLLPGASSSAFGGGGAPRPSVDRSATGARTSVNDYLLTCESTAMSLRLQWDDEAGEKNQCRALPQPSHSSVPLSANPVEIG
jgi:hypothetical protein